MPLPRPLKGSAEPHFSFAGLKSAVARAVGHHSPEDIAASFQQAVVDCLLDRTRRALANVPPVTALVVAGGVAANGVIRGRWKGSPPSMACASSRRRSGCAPTMPR
ncbi:hypothetical protein GCM10020258_18080 [Sphingomonas yabuuchiae]